MFLLAYACASCKKTTASNTKEQVPIELTKEDFLSSDDYQQYTAILFRCVEFIQNFPKLSCTDRESSVELDPGNIEIENTVFTQTEYDRQKDEVIENQIVRVDRRCDYPLRSAGSVLNLCSKRSRVFRKTVGESNWVGFCRKRDEDSPEGLYSEIGLIAERNGNVCFFSSRIEPEDTIDGNEIPSLDPLQFDKKKFAFFSR